MILKMIDLLTRPVPRRTCSADYGEEDYVDGKDNIKEDLRSVYSGMKMKSGERFTVTNFMVYTIHLSVI